jgi:hypothetical protein
VARSGRGEPNDAAAFGLPFAAAAAAIVVVFVFVAAPNGCKGDLANGDVSKENDDLEATVVFVGGDVAPNNGDVAVEVTDAFDVDVDDEGTGDGTPKENERGGGEASPNEKDENAGASAASTGATNADVVVADDDGDDDDSDGDGDDKEAPNEKAPAVELAGIDDDVTASNEN